MICESCGRKMQVGHGGGLGLFFYCASDDCEPKFFTFDDPEVLNQSEDEDEM